VNFTALKRRTSHTKNQAERKEKEEEEEEKKASPQRSQRGPATVGVDRTRNNVTDHVRPVPRFVLVLVVLLEARFLVNVHAVHLAPCLQIALQRAAEHGQEWRP
jgi:Flp pilus assembly protein TadB